MKQVDVPELLQQAFSEAGLEHIKVLEFPEGTRTAADAANAIGCDISDIGKSLLFMTERNKPVLIIMNGADRVDENRVAAILGLSIRKASADEVRTHTGYAIGGVPPFGHIEPVETMIDTILLTKDEIWAAAGKPNTVFKIKPDELREITGIETGIDIAVD